MELIFLPVLLGVVVYVVYVFNAREQRQRIALLGSVLGKYQIEQLMENLTEGYLRWLDESDAARKAQIMGVLEGTEQALAAQFASFAQDFQQRVPAPQAQVSKLPIALPFAQPLLPAWRLFDARRLFALHANAIDACARNTLQLAPKPRAYMMTAELYLMQHSCHWFCRSKTLASARLGARHKTRYEQVLAAVSPQTREAYRALTGV